MTISPTKAFQTLAMNLRSLTRLGDIKKLGDFMASQKYLENFAALSPKHKLVISGYVADAWASANRRVEPLPRWSKKGWRTWTPERIAALKAADAKYGTDEGIARALKISLKAAERARYRYIGKRPEGYRFGSDTTVLAKAA